MQLLGKLWEDSIWDDSFTGGHLVVLGRRSEGCPKARIAGRKANVSLAETHVVRVTRRRTEADVMVTLNLTSG